jgi:hypothetical protein
MRTTITVTMTLAAVLAGSALASGPWERTETRAECSEVTPLRRPLFGDLHVHTGASHDAHLWATRVEPRDAYAFARGGAVTVPDASGALTRTVRLERPLDLTAVTDHAEFLGEVRVCNTPASPAFSDPMCAGLREVGDQAAETNDFLTWGFPLGLPDPSILPSQPLCDVAGVDCDGGALSVWQEIQAAAEEAYDRSAACAFTTFVGYEHTASPVGSHLHRNVVFRNEHVPAVPTGYLETGENGAAQPLWDALDRDCTAGAGCEALTIPHNSNLSGGLRWPDPPDVADAERRRRLEPLVEIFQHKAGSECRVDRLAGMGTDTADEFCTFEQDPRDRQGPFARPPVETFPRRNLVRNVLKDGLALEDVLGVNPFRLGFVGSTDTHNGTPGATEERAWEGAQGFSDATPVGRIDTEPFAASRMRFNPGGLAVVWAEENSRDAVFAALRRRETYATSGTRPVVRFFAGRLEGVACGQADVVEQAYREGVPMGGEIGPVRAGASPRFLVMAAKDAGTNAIPGTALQRVQIVKGWADAAGEVHETVVDVVGDGSGGAGVNPQTCEPVGAGAAELCAVWEDPDFDPATRAFYYARVLENPTCRWSTWLCRAAGVDPLAADCETQAAEAGSPYEVCCWDEESDAFMQPVVQERAWTSPIWYRPDAITRLRGVVKRGRRPGRGALSLSVRLGRVPADFDPAAAATTLRLADDALLLDVVVPAGSFRAARGGRRWVLPRAAKTAAPLTRAVFRVRRDGQVDLKVRATRLDLSGVPATDHAVHFEMAVGTHRAEHQRRWLAKKRTLVSPS